MEYRTFSVCSVPDQEVGRGQFKLSEETAHHGCFELKCQKDPRKLRYKMLHISDKLQVATSKLMKI